MLCRKGCVGVALLAMVLSLCGGAVASPQDRGYTITAAPVPDQDPPGNLVRFKFEVPKKFGTLVFTNADLVIMKDRRKRAAVIPVMTWTEQGTSDVKSQMYRGKFVVSKELIGKCVLRLCGVDVKSPVIDTVWAKEIKLSEVKIGK